MNNFGKLLTVTVIGATIVGCSGREDPQASEQQNTPVPAVQGEIALTSEAQPATVPLVEMIHPALSAHPKVEYQATLPGETFHITTYGTEGIDFIPVAFTLFTEFLDANVVGKQVFEPNDLPITAGNITLKGRPQGSHHFINLFRNELAQDPAVTDQLVTSDFMIDSYGNSINIIPTGGTEQSLRLAIAGGLFDLNIEVVSDAFYENSNTATTIRQSYSAAFLAAQDGRSYEGYKAFANDLHEQGLLEDEPVFVTFEAYLDLTLAVATYKLPAFFTISPVQQP